MVNVQPNLFTFLLLYFFTFKQYESMLNDAKTITGTLVNIVNKIKNKNNVK